MSYKAHDWARRQTAPCPASKALLLELASRANTDDVCWPGIKCLATTLQLTPRTIQRGIAKLKDAGLIVADVRHRPDGGQSSNLYRLPVGEGGPNPNPDVTGPSDTDIDPPAAPETPQEKKTIKLDTSDEVSRAPDAPDAFDVFWECYPKKVEMRGAKLAFSRLIRKGQVLVETLIEGAKRYAATVADRDQKFVKHPTTWLNNGCWADGTSVACGLAAAREEAMAVFAGPANVRSAVLNRKGLAWVVSWFDPCVWTDGSRTLHPRTGLAVQRIRQEIGECLRELGVTVVEPVKSLRT